MQAQNIVSVSWGDHLAFGEGDGRLDTPKTISRRMERWRVELDASMLHWRLHRRHLKGHYYVARGYLHPARVNVPPWNDLEVIPGLAREAGLQAWLYVSIFDEGWPLPPKKIRQYSYHNAMHGQHVSWQTEFSRSHPEYALIDRTGTQRQWGVLCLAYPEVRKHFRQRFLDLLAGRGFDGLFVCLRSQSRPADFADQYGFNEPVRQEYQSRYGRDICAQDFDLQSWRDLRGSYLTLFLRELRADLQPLGLHLAVGAARGDVLGPPLGNMTLDWRTWVRQGLIDGLVINQNSSQCPSMWHPLWPMHRGYGYLQNYLDGFNLPPLRQHLEQTYAPGFAGKSTALYVARQWEERSPDEEVDLLQQSPVTGLVFSSFRHDNPDAIARNDWRI
jgi:hypothetical protein